MFCFVFSELKFFFFALSFFIWAWTQKWFLLWFSNQIGRCQEPSSRELWTECSTASGKVAHPNLKQQMFIKNRYQVFKSHFEKLKCCFNVPSRMVKIAFLKIKNLLNGFEYKTSTRAELSCLLTNLIVFDHNSHFSRIRAFLKESMQFTAILYS